MRPTLEVADIVRAHCEAFRQAHAESLSVVSCLVVAGFFLPVEVLSRRFRKLYLRYLERADTEWKLHFCGELQPLSDPESFTRYVAPLLDSDWVVYAKTRSGRLPPHLLIRMIPI